MLIKLLKKYYSLIPLPLKNKFVIVSIFFLMWMLFFDKNSFYNQLKLQATLEELNSKLSYYDDEIKVDSKKSVEISSDDKNLEKFAREEHLMKRSDEEIFIIVTKDK
jgi:cell division protein DivIC